MVDDAVIYEGPFANGYDSGRALLPDAEEAWAKSVEGLVPPTSTVLDVGAGTGRFSGLFGRRVGCSVVAVEPAGAMRSRGAARRQASVAWVAGRAESLPVRDGAVDVVWLACVVHYLDLDAAGREFARVLRRGGQVLVRGTFPERFDDVEWLRWFPAARALDEGRMPTVSRLEEAWRRCGLYLAERRLVQHLAAASLEDLAERLSYRSISTLELIPDAEFETGMTALREAATSDSNRPVYSPVDTLSFRRGRAV